ncbi:LOW QUALITY PROTEIN: flavin reductase (NADPH) [Melospiza melodia melodia]|uniref:LOW QUALITY PROTEIN: flavin reductase (NADPH) n=1 Tax=Melospiza melodia melodia TaxID=1914991 RepID=UPI002FD1B12B
MKIAIFGATGRTGRVTLGLALEQGFEVTVLVRDPSRLPAGPSPSRVVVGDARDPGAVGAALQGQDGGASCLGTGSDLGPTTVMSEGTRTILEAMAEHGVRKVVACLSAFLLWDPERVPERLRALTEDHRRMERLLRDSGLPAVLVMPPRHLDRPLTGDYEVTVGAAGGPAPPRVISAPDLGHFMLRCLRTDEFDGKSVYVSRHYPKE